MDRGAAISELADHHAEVIVARPERVPPPILARLREVLDDAERARAAELVFARDRELFVLAHGLLRFRLAGHLGRDPRELRFVRQGAGRPELAGGGAASLRFNISHTEGLVACVLTRASACGVDVQRLDRVAHRDLFAAVLAPSERPQTEALDDDSSRDRFIEIWTLKEAYLKARGLGLAVPMTRIAFSGFGGVLACSVDPELEDDGGQWRFWSVRLTGRHRAAAAVRTGGPEATFSLVEADADFPWG